MKKCFRNTTELLVNCNNLTLHGFNSKIVINLFQNTNLPKVSMIMPTRLFLLFVFKLWTHLFMFFLGFSISLQSVSFIITCTCITVPFPWPMINTTQIRFHFIHSLIVYCIFSPSYMPFRGCFFLFFFLLLLYFLF